MRILRSVLAVCAAALIFAQCAKKEDEDYEGRDQAAFDLWMEINHDRPGVEKLENGMYMERLRTGTGSRLATDNHMYIDYRGYTLDGNIFSNRDPETAVEQGTFTRYTRYTDHFALYNPTARLFTEAEYEALALMKEGDSVRLYIPPALGYSTTSSSSTFAYGYEGWYNSTLNPANSVSGTGNMLLGAPVIIELALKDIVADADASELSTVQAAAQTMGGFTQDTVGLFFRYIEDPDGEISGEDRNSAVIAEDSTFYFVYELRFLDDTLLATNDRDAAYDAWGDYWTSYAPTYFSKSTKLLSGSGGGYISAINELIKRQSVTVRYNSKMQLLFTSDWAFGDYGEPATSTKPVVYPYTPLKMEMTILEYGYDPNAKEEEK